MRLLRVLPIGLVAASAVLIGVLSGGCNPQGGPQAPASSGTQALPGGTGFAIDAGSGEVARMGLRQSWTTQLKLAAGDRVQQICLLGEQLVVVTDMNYCYAIEINFGEWRPMTEIAPQKTGPFKQPYFDGFHYFFAGTSRLIGVNAATGQKDIEINLNMPSNVRAISDREFVYTGSLDGKIFAYSVASQQKHWEGKTGPAVVSLQFCQGNVVAARSDVLKGRGEVFMIAAKKWNEAPLWTQFTEGPITAPIVTTPQPDEAIFVASEDGSIYRFNPQHGWSEWRVFTPAPLVDAPLVLEDAVVQIVPGNGTWIIERLGLGEVRWKAEQTLAYLGRSTDKTRWYFFDAKTGSILAKNPKDGTTLGTMPVQSILGSQRLMTVPNPAGTRLFLADAAGNIICFDESKLPFQAVE